MGRRLANSEYIIGLILSNVSSTSVLYKVGVLRFGKKILSRVS